MNVSIHQIGPDQEELAKLFVRELDRSVESLADYIRQERYRAVRVVCALDGRTYQIGSGEIYTVETDRDAQLVYTKSQVYKTSVRLYELEALLPPSFVRISKSVILNLDMVKCYKPLLNGLMEAELTNGRTVYISRRFLKGVREKLAAERSFTL